MSDKKDAIPAGIPEGLTDAVGLSKTLMDPPPGLRTIRAWQAQRIIPYLKIGRRVYFDPAKVRAALERRFTVHAA